MISTGLKVVVWAACATGMSGIAAAQIGVVTRGDGPTLLMANAPFRCERVTNTSVRLQDGGTLKREQHEEIGRDADGRVFSDSYMTPVGGKTERHFYLIADPVAKRVVSWSDERKTGNSIPFGGAAHWQLVALSLDRGDEQYFLKSLEVVKTEDLGVKTISGLRATGTRTTTMAPAGAVGNDQPLTKTQEIWVADDLGLVVEETDTNAITGTRTVKLVSVERSAPAANLFEVPPDVTVKPGIGGIFGAPPAR